MLWLVWHMWILLLLAFAGGVIAGWILRSRSDAAPARPALTAAAPAPKPKPAAETPPAPNVPAPEPAPAKADAPARADAKPKAAAAPKADAKPKAAEKPKPADKPKADPAPKAAPEPASSSDDGRDDLTAIKGLGPRAAEKLAAEGVTRLSQIAAWSAADIEKFDAVVNARGRIARDDWVGQAKALTKG